MVTRDIFDTRYTSHQRYQHKFEIGFRNKLMRLLIIQRIQGPGCWMAVRSDELTSLCLTDYIQCDARIGFDPLGRKERKVNQTLGVEKLYFARSA